MRMQFLRAHAQAHAHSRSGQRLLVATLLGLAFPVAPLAQGQGGGVSVSGFVRDTLGLAIVGAELSIDGSSLRTLSAGDGRYLLSGVPPGEVRMRVRRLGFRPTVMDLELGAGGLSDVEIQLVQLVQQLESVAVLGRREAYASRLAGFEERRQRKVGHFITRERLERTHSFSMTDVLRDVPGVNVRQIGVIQKAVRIRGSPCPPLVFIDGSPATAGEFDLETIDLGMVEGIEVYSGSATVPAEFAGPRNLDRCGVVAIWSRPFRPRPRVTKSVDAPSEVSLDRLVARGEAHTAATVDSAVALIDGGLAPEYPGALLRDRRSGRVLTEFVVDTTGAVVPGTIGIISSSHPLFSLAAREALSQAQFLPARKGGALVRQVVQLPIEFRVPTRPNRP